MGDERHSTRATPTWFVEPSLSRRFFGSVIDTLVLAPLSLLYLVSSTTTVSLTVVTLEAIYEILLTAVTGQTLGKVAMGTRVVDSVDGTLISLSRSVVRWAVIGGGFVVLSTFARDLTPLLGIYSLVLGVMVLRPPLHQGPHDLAAGTLVTYVGRPAAR